jgi:hypothetical protein
MIGMLSMTRKTNDDKNIERRLGDWPPISFGGEK